MKKIIVIGPSGAGKSTFSRKLNKIINVPIYHLDNLFWKVDKTHIEKDLFDLKLNEILEQDEWIIDGDYSRTYEIRFKNADTIFFLNYDLNTCLKGVEARIGHKREDIPWVESEFDPEFKSWIINWFNETLPVVEKLIKVYKNKNIIVFNNREEANDYLILLKKNLAVL